VKGLFFQVAPFSLSDVSSFFAACVVFLFSFFFSLSICESLAFNFPEVRLAFRGSATVLLYANTACILVLGRICFPLNLDGDY